MHTLLVVDDDDAMRGLVRLNLAEDYKVIDTGEPEHALALALEHKPDAILLDLRMPRYSGFELCQTLTSFSSTQRIPVLVVSGEGGSKTKEFCRDLGASAYFQKPVDFAALKETLERILGSRLKERRSEIRVRLRVALRLTGVDQEGRPFGVLTTTENVSRSGFLCASNVALALKSVVDVHVVGAQEEHVGRAEIVRSEWGDTAYPRYGCRFREKTGPWVLQ